MVRFWIRQNSFSDAFIGAQAIPTMHLRPEFHIGDLILKQRRFPLKKVLSGQGSAVGAAAVRIFVQRERQREQ